MALANDSGRQGGVRDEKALEAELEEHYDGNSAARPVQAPVGQAGGGSITQAPVGQEGGGSITQGLRGVYVGGCVVLLIAVTAAAGGIPGFLPDLSTVARAGEGHSHFEAFLPGDLQGSEWELMLKGRQYLAGTSDATGSERSGEPAQDFPSTIQGSDGTFPRFYRHTGGQDLAEAITSTRQFIDAELHKHGCLVLRGLPFAGPTQFSELLHGMGYNLTRYIGGQSIQSHSVYNKTAQHLDSRCVLLSDPTTFGAGGSLPKHVSNRIQIL